MRPVNSATILGVLNLARTALACSGCSGPVDHVEQVRHVKRDLHNGAGLSDATSPDGEVSIKVFDKVQYDLLAIGNHELYLAEVAYQALGEISAYWGEKYLTSNVQILNRETKEWQYIGNTHRYFTTKHGFRIMAFGILFNFTSNTNVSKVIPAKTMATQKWVLDVIRYPEPVDIFAVLGHNHARSTDKASTFPIVLDAIRAVRSDTPIQFIGFEAIVIFEILLFSTVVVQHSSRVGETTHIFDETLINLLGRYCETLGWLSMSGFDNKNSGYSGSLPGPIGVPNPTRKAIQNSTSPFVHSRLYLDWNRRTFEYHAATRHNKNFDHHSGLAVTADITKDRKQLNLT
ncbi:Metallo-dependent phosphatase-like protein [Daldinia bambusicola]|nr:Metallo-dependent phosphatase-like protein [Daldinia bambusicola]